MSYDHLGMLYMFHVHVILSILAFFGLFLLYRWIITTQPPHIQGRIAVWVLILSGLGITITVPYCLAGIRLMHGMIL